jgi:pimeloyl-ACP methyl ester carboxylesterase
MAALDRRPASKLSTVLTATSAALGAAALVNYLVAKRTESRNPPTGKFITVDGVRLHYIERGTGMPVVFLHGSGTSADDYDVSGVLDLVAKNHRVIAFDRPGFGHSERPRSTIWTVEAQARLLHKSLGQLDVSRPILVGHSWGTLVALEMALDNPLDTAGLVLLSGYYFPSARADVALAPWPAVPVLGDIMRYTVSPLVGWLMASAVYQRLFAPSAVTARFTARFPLGMTLRPSQIRASAADTALMMPGAASLLGRHGELKVPVVIMAGDGDKIFDIERQSQRLHSDIPQSDMRSIQGAGHMIHHLVPERVAEAINAVTNTHAQLAGDSPAFRP